jgi:signal transduction histidine kinase
MIEQKKQPTDFAAVFDAHCHMGWSANMKPDIKAIVENPYEHLTVVIDEELTGKIIEQLASVSIFYTKEGMVRAKYEYRQGALNITIEDTGRGFSQEVLPHIFDRFGRNKNEEQFGTGLLLPIVKGLTELMGGIIEITSEKGKGTTAWVSIPCELISSEKKKQII